MTPLRAILSRSPLAPGLAIGLAALCTLGWLAWTGCSQDTTAPVPPPPGPDETPPAQITDPVLSYAAAGDAATLSWSAPRDDAEHERVDHYDIRFSYSLPFDWDVSIPADNPPSPAAPNTQQTYIYAAPTRGRDLYAAIRSVDAAGNVSPISPIAEVHIVGYTIAGTCIDALSAAPVDGLAVTLTGHHAVADTTDAAGAFSAADVSGGTEGVTIRTGAAAGSWHSIDYAFLLDADVSRTYAMIPYQPVVSAYYDNVFQVFLDAAQLTGSSKIFKKWRSLPVPLYIPDWVNAYGLDYGATARQAAQRWMDRTGITLFSFVSQAPDTGVTFFYKTRAEMGGTLTGVTKHINDADGYPVQDLVSIIDEFSDPDKLYQTMLHELGHTIRFGHLPPGFIMYGGQPLPGDITDIEVQAVQLYEGLPNGLDVSIYDPEPPATR